VFQHAIIRVSTPLRPPLLAQTFMSALCKYGRRAPDVPHGRAPFSDPWLFRLSGPRLNTNHPKLIKLKRVAATPAASPSLLYRKRRIIFLPSRTLLAPVGSFRSRLATNPGPEAGHGCQDIKKTARPPTIGRCSLLRRAPREEINGCSILHRGIAGAVWLAPLKLRCPTP